MSDQKFKVGKSYEAQVQSLESDIYFKEGMGYEVCFIDAVYILRGKEYREALPFNNFYTATSWKKNFKKGEIIMMDVKGEN